MKAENSKENVFETIKKGNDRVFGAVRGLDITFEDHSVSYMSIEHKIEVKLLLEDKTFMDADKPETINYYYINFWSFWASSEQADTLAFILGGVASVAKDLEKLGLVAKN